MATGKVAEQAIEAAAEVAEVVAEESADVAVATRALNPRDAGLIIGGLGLGVALGFAGGYFFLNKRLKTKYEELLNEEVISMREHYHRKERALEGREAKAELETDRKAARKISESERYSGADKATPIPYHKIGEEPEDEAPEQPEVVNNLETNRVESDDILPLNPDWDYEKELKNRDPHTPYVIHRDEYDEGPHGDKIHEKHTLTYFAGDDVLSTDRDSVIDDKDDIIGVENLARFGHGSGDPNTVYIRNEQMEIDIEVVHSDGKYATEVHGFKDDEIRHSSMARRIPRRSDFDGDS